MSDFTQLILGDDNSQSAPVCNGTVRDMIAEIERLNAQVEMLLEVLERAEISISAFLGDEGWGISDMDNLDAVSAAQLGVLW